MAFLQFQSNSAPTLGVELELQLVDESSWELKPLIREVLERLPADQEWAKPELMQSYLEINTGVCDTVDRVRQDLTSKIRTVDGVVRRLGGRLLWSATHPFSLWMDQRVTPDERYEKLIEAMQDTARRIVTFGMHVHVGVDSGDKAVMVQDRLNRHLPMLLALSVNSPFWVGRKTGLQSQRVKIMEQLPAAGLPPNLRNYSEYCWVVNHSLQTGFIGSIREIWWDVRPHPGFGTVEVRICDLPMNLEAVLELTALVQCLVVALGEQIDEGVYQRDVHPMMVKQNKWRALRYGMEAEFVDPVTHRTFPVRESVREVVEKLRPFAVRLQCENELLGLLARIDAPTGAETQLRIHDEVKGDFRELVRRMVSENELTGG